MALLRDGERREKSTALGGFKNQAIQAINALKGIKSNVVKLKTAVEEDGVNFDTNDTTDVQSVIDFINTEIGNI